MSPALPLVLLLIAFQARAEQARQQKEAVAAIEKLGGQVMYDYQLAKPPRPNVFDPSAAPPRVSREARERYSDDFFRTVVYVDLSSTKAGDDDLKHLAKLRRLMNLNLASTPVTGTGLTHLK